MQRSRFGLTVSLILTALSSTAAGAPVYTATAGSAGYVNALLAMPSSLVNSFSFSGPLVGIMGSGGNNVGFTTLESLNVPFSFSVPLVIDDTGDESGPASANGTDYASVQYTGDASISSTSPITLTAGNLTVSVPATASGTLSVCNPSGICAFGGGVPDHVFDVDFAVSGTLTVTYALFNPPVGTQYALTTASFTTAVPEPAGWMLLAEALALSAAGRTIMKSA
jgi:hypothetical protein